MILLDDTKICKQRPYRLSPAKSLSLNKQIDEMLENGIIQPSVSEFASPVVMVTKPDSTFRLTVDYRLLNSNTRSDSYPIRDIEDMFRNLKGSRIFSVFDLKSAFWQIPLCQDDIPKSAFICERGLYEFRVLPFGMRNGTATINRVMEIIFWDLLGKSVNVIHDNINVFSADIPEHIVRVRQVLSRLREYGLTLNQKYEMFVNNHRCLGYVVSSEGIYSDPDKIKPIVDFPEPTDVKSVERFVGMCGWYSKFINNYSKLVEPLNKLKQKGIKFQFNDICRNAFNSLKQVIMSPMVLAFPDVSKPFLLYCDYSGTGIGSSLNQMHAEGLRPIGFASRQLSSAERNYSPTEGECLAVVRSL